MSKKKDLDFVLEEPVDVSELFNSEEDEVTNEFPTQTESNEIEKEFVKVVNGTLNLRERPSKESNIVEQMKDGSKIELLETWPMEDETWLKVKTDNNIGFCMERFTEKV